MSSTPNAPTRSYALVALLIQIVATAYAIPPSMDLLMGIKDRVAALLCVIIATFLAMILSKNANGSYTKIDWLIASTGFASVLFFLYLIYC